MKPLSSKDYSVHTFFLHHQHNKLFILPILFLYTFFAKKSVRMKVYVYQRVTAIFLAAHFYFGLQLQTQFNSEIVFESSKVN